MNYYIDMDGVIANFHKEAYKYANAISRKWIANLDPFENNIAIVKELIHENHKVFILTKAASENAKLGKIDWLHKYIPEINEEHFICIVGSGRKVDYIKTTSGILIDDDIKNIRQWVKGGYEAIHIEAKGQTITL